jgi:predicted Zn finger-like uncharacterized protein
MKFVCPSCGAGYRIADETIADRSHPRMKCRKCDHVISVREAALPDSGEATTEASTAASLLPSQAPPPASLPAPSPASVPPPPRLPAELETGTPAAWFEGAPSSRVPESAGAIGVGPHASMPPSGRPSEFERRAGLRPRALSPRAWLLAVAAYGLGVLTGALWFGASESPESVAVATGVDAGLARAARTPESAVDPRVADAAPAREADPALDSPAVPRRAPRPGVGPRPGPAPAPSGRGLLAGLPATGVRGPQVTGDDAPAAPKGRELSSAEIQRTIAANQGSVRNGCWQPALNARESSAPSSARVNVTLTVGPSGSVERVSSGGDPPGYPGLAACIERRVRGFTFPRSEAPTTVNVPFVFASQ